MWRGVIADSNRPLKRVLKPLVPPHLTYALQLGRGREAGGRERRDRPREGGKAGGRESKTRQLSHGCENTDGWMGGRM